LYLKVVDWVVSYLQKLVLLFIVSNISILIIKHI
jgi:hypothetical protein